MAEDPFWELQKRLMTGEGDATDEQLAESCECPRDVYVEDQTALRQAFGPTAIRKWTTFTYDDGTPRYSVGNLEPGDLAPDMRVLLAKPTGGSMSYSEQELQQVSLSSFSCYM